MNVQGYSLVSGDGKVVGPITVKDEAGAAKDVSGWTFKYRWFPIVNSVIDGATESLVKADGPDWQATTAYVLKDFVQPLTPDGFFYECTTAGTSGASEPSWPAVLGNTIADGSVVWTCRAIGVEFDSDGTDGKINVTIDPTETASLSGPFHHELLATDGASDKWPAILAGTVLVLADLITA